MSSAVTENRLAIVTGASKHNGIGFATAYALAQEGVDVSQASRWIVD